MTDDRKRILSLLAEGRISADEADRLISALERAPAAVAPPEQTPRKVSPKYLRVEVNADPKHAYGGHGGPAKVNVRVPMAFLKAGVRLSSILPADAREQINAAMARKGVDFDINQLKPDNLEALVEQLGDLSVDVGHQGATVRVYCE
jgi:hypothetical protein